MSDKQLYIVRGTGLALDGTIVEVASIGGDGYISVLPWKGSKIEPIMIKEKYLQPIDHQDEYIYKIYITKSNTIGEIVGSDMVIISETIKNINVSVIAEFIESNLKPLIKGN